MSQGRAAAVKSVVCLYLIKVSKPNVVFNDSYKQPSLKKKVAKDIDYIGSLTFRIRLTLLSKATNDVLKIYFISMCSPILAKKCFTNRGREMY